MRIALFTNIFPSLSETFILNKVKALAERGHEIIVLAGKKNKDEYNLHFAKEKNVRIQILSVRGMIAHLSLRPFLSIKLLTKNKKTVFNYYRLSVINSLAADILHFEFSGIGIDYLQIIAKFKGKKIVSCRGSGEKVKLLVSEERKTKFKQLFKLVDAIHCVSADMTKTILPYCTEPEKIMINYPSIDADFFEQNQLQQILETKYIISVGRLDFSKGYLIGLLAIKQLIGTGLRFKWIIIGNGTQHDELIFHIHKMNLQEYVELPGSANATEIKKTLEAGTIFFLPSVYEGIANSALEAMSMQLPVVATKSGGMEEVITHGVNGMLAEVYDYHQLALHLEYLLKNPEAGWAMGKLARKRVLENFTLNQQIDKYEDFYTQLIKPAN